MSRSPLDMVVKCWYTPASLRLALKVLGWIPRRSDKALMERLQSHLAASANHSLLICFRGHPLFPVLSVWTTCIFLRCSGSLKGVYLLVQKLRCNGKINERIYLTCHRHPEQPLLIPPSTSQKYVQ